MEVAASCRAVKVDHSAAVKISAGPDGFLESRTPTRLFGRNATSTQFLEPALRLLLNHFHCDCSFITTRSSRFPPGSIAPSTPRCDPKRTSTVDFHAIGALSQEELHPNVISQPGAQPRLIRGVRDCR